MVNANIVQSVDRALQIIDIISSNRGGSGVTELSQQIGLNKSSVFRILSTLAAHDYVEKDPETNRYKLGYKYLELSSVLLDSINLRTEAKPYLRELEEISNEVVHLVVFDEGDVVYIEKLEGNETLRMHSQVGKRAPMHCTSVGKVILSYLSRQEVLQIIQQKGLPVHTENTITDIEELLVELVRVREKGYALDLEENEEGITCIAAPIFDHRGEITAAISISGPTMRMTDDRMGVFKEKLTATGKEISYRIGFKKMESRTP